MKTLTLAKGAFNTELLKIVGDQRTDWPGKEHLAFVQALLPHLEATDGTKIEPTENQMDVLRLTIRPTEPLQRKVLKQALAEMEFELDPATESVFGLLMNHAQFANYLEDTKRPGSEKTFIQKGKKRGSKKGLFEDLITSTAEATTTDTAVPKEAEEILAEMEILKKKLEAATAPEVSMPPAAAKATTTKVAAKK